MADWILIIGVCVLILFLLFLLTPRSSIPGPTTVPILGNLLALRKAKPGEHYMVYKQLAKQYGDIYRLFMGRQLVVRLNTYKIINEAFVQKADVFSGRPDFLQNDGKGILCGSGEDCRRLRTVFANKMQALDDLVSDKRTYEERIQRETQVLTERLNLSLDQPIVINKLFFAASCNIILDILFGVRHEYEDDLFKELVEADMTCSKELPPVSMLGLLFPILKSILPKVNKSNSQMIIDKYAENMIKECRNTFDEKNIRCLVDTLIQAERTGEISGEAFSEKNVSCAVSDVLFAAIGNIGVVLSWCIVYMIRYPEIQEKCRDEIIKVTGSERKVRLSDRDKLKFTQAAILEVERLATTAPITVPHVATEDGVLRGHHIPKGSILVGDILAACVMNLDDGDEFRPERHLERSGEIQSEINLLWGIGPRACLGAALGDMETFLLFSNLLQQFTFSKTSPSDDFEFKGHLGLLMITPDFKVRLGKNKL